MNRSPLSRLLPALALLCLALTPSPVWAQADPAAAALATLPAEDQEIASKLKFSQLELSPLDSRRFVYVKGSIKVTNNSAKNVVAGKLELEGLTLCRNKDKEWKVVRVTAPLLPPRKILIFIVPAGKFRKCY